MMTPSPLQSPSPLMMIRHDDDDDDDDNDDDKSFSGVKWTLQRPAGTVFKSTKKLRSFDYATQEGAPKTKNLSQWESSRWDFPVGRAG